MRDERHPSATEFVVKTRSVEDLKIKSLGDIEPIEGEDALYVLHMSSEDRDARAAWRRAQDTLHDCAIAPVMVDREGQSHYPTGQIRVRFAKTPDDGELESFSKQHKLRIVGRNEFQPAQVEFEPADPGHTFLPDCVEELDRTPNVKSAWPVTKTRYRRF